MTRSARPRPLPAALAVLIVLAAPPAARAEVEPAVGRLNHAGYRTRVHCTATLIGPREVVTARHCVEGVEPGDLHVVLGFDRGDYVHHGRVATVSASPDHDIARLCLEDVAPVEPRPALRAGVPAPGAVEVLGYPASRSQAQTAQACNLTPREGSPEAILDCPLEQGVSGAPVTTDGGDGPRVVAVASASNERLSVVVTLGALPSGGCGED